jgi:hypothetical protein
MQKSSALLFAFFLFLFVIPVSGQDQTHRLLVLGKIISARDSSGLNGAVVLCKSPPRTSFADKKGYYGILVDYKSGVKLEFRYYGYKTVYKTINAELLSKANGDTLHLNIFMQPDVIDLNEQTITAKSGPDTVIGNWHFFIEDYVFTDSGRYVLLTFEKSLKAAKVMLADNTQKIISQANVPVEALNLYEDYQGHINVMCKDSAFRVHIFPDNHIGLMALPYGDFCSRMLPCVDTLGGKILFSNYNRDYPAFTYFAYNPTDTSVKPIRGIVDKELLAQYNWEFDYLLPKDRLYARKMEAYTGIDKRIIAATMTGFPNSIYYTPLYAPMFVVHDTICIFDHYSDSLFLYDKTGKEIHASKISYHHPANWKEWDRSLHQDEKTGEIYARFEKGGFYYLKRIDIKTGNITGTFKISVQYVKHIHIYDGEVYYIFRPTESIQKKYLYKERIELQ